MEITVKAVMLSSIDYKENDKLITLFTLQNGKILASMKGVKKVTAKLRFAAEPFCFAEYTLIEKSGRYTVKTVESIDLFYEIRRDIFKFYSASCIVEITRILMQEGMINEDYFLLIINSLKKICYEFESCSKILIFFLLNALKYAGYEINLHNCAVCGKEYPNKIYFDKLNKQFTCEDCRSNVSNEIDSNIFILMRAISDEKKYKTNENINFYYKETIKILTQYIKFVLSENVNSLTEFVNL